MNRLVTFGIFIAFASLVLAQSRKRKEASKTLRKGRGKARSPDAITTAAIHGTPEPPPGPRGRRLLIDAARSAAHRRSSHDRRVPPPLPVHPRDAVAKVRAAEDGWNSRDPARVALATPRFPLAQPLPVHHGRAEIEASSPQMQHELDYRLIKDSGPSREPLAVRFAYDTTTLRQLFRAYGNETGSSPQRPHAPTPRSINDSPSPPPPAHSMPSPGPPPPGLTDLGCEPSGPAGVRVRGSGPVDGFRAGPGLLASVEALQIDELNRAVVAEACGVRREARAAKAHQTSLLGVVAPGREKSRCAGGVGGG